LGMYNLVSIVDGSKCGKYNRELIQLCFFL
jgi:hypothetical protein